MLNSVNILLKYKHPYSETVFKRAVSHCPQPRPPVQGAKIQWAGPAPACKTCPIRADRACLEAGLKETGTKKEHPQTDYE